MWSGILNENVGNGHIENFNKQIKANADNEHNIIGQRPTNCLRFLKAQ